MLMLWFVFSLSERLRWAWTCVIFLTKKAFNWFHINPLITLTVAFCCFKNLNVFRWQLFHFLYDIAIDIDTRTNNLTLECWRRNTKAP